MSCVCLPVRTAFSSASVFLLSFIEMFVAGEELLNKYLRLPLVFIIHASRIWQMITAIISVAIPVDGTRGWVSFGLLVVELNLIVWVGYYSDRNAGNAVKELEVTFLGDSDRVHEGF